VQMFRSKKTNTEFVALGAVKDWRDAGYEIEALGHRLDAARERAAEASSKWAKDYWTITVDRLFNKWELMIQLKDTGLRQQGPSSVYSKIDYDWWEKSDEIKMIGFPWLDHYFDNAGLQGRLDESWANSKEEKLQKARQGLA
jgi:hypothetical protein